MKFGAAVRLLIERSARNVLTFALVATLIKFGLVLVRSRQCTMRSTRYCSPRPNGTTRYRTVTKRWLAMAGTRRICRSGRRTRWTTPRIPTRAHAHLRASAGPYVRAAQGTLLAQRYDGTSEFVFEIDFDAGIAEPTELFVPRGRELAALSCDGQDCAWTRTEGIVSVPVQSGRRTLRAILT
jgi:hypothetical protein